MSTTGIAFVQLRREDLTELARSDGPSVTILLPPFQPGGQRLNSPEKLLRSLLQDAAVELSRTNVTEAEAAGILDPLHGLASDPSLDAGSHLSRIILRSRETLRAFYLRERVDANIWVRGRFQMAAPIKEADLPDRFYILKLSRKSVGLWRAGLDLELIPLPRGIPASVDEFVELEKPDHDLENRSSIGGPAAGERRVRFGTTTDREAQRAHVSDFFKALDRGLRGTIGKDPVILGGVEEDTALYRSISECAGLVESTIRSGADGSEMLQEGWAILRAASIERAADALRDARERYAAARFATDIGDISKYASDGRVHRLYIAELRASDEAINTAAVETLCHGGGVSILPPGRMTEAAAAVLRF
ncbi:MAG: hypothetical protein ACRD30_09905 [Bryobacteraceae bacterium]